MTQSDESAKTGRSAGARKSNRTVIALFAIGLGTVVASYSLFFAVSGQGGFGTTNRGTLIDPPMHASRFALRTASGSVHEPGATWWLWVVADSCETPCVALLDDLRALHILLNRDSHRLRRALVTPQGREVNDDQALVPLQTSSPPAQGVYIVDPHGNLVLSYPLETTPKDVLDDLKRLLKLSQIG